MNQRQQEFRVGIVALATGMIVVLLVALNTGTTLRFGEAPYELLIRVDRAPGVGPNTPVQKDGVLIGRVERTEFLQGGGVLVRANILPGAPIYRGDACRIQPSSLFGDAVINFSFTGEAGDASPLDPGAEVSGMALPDPIEALTSLQVEVGPAIKSIGDAADGVTELTSRVSNALGDEFGASEVNSLVSETRTAMARFTTTMDRMSATLDGINAIVDDPEIQAGIREAVTQAPELLADARVTVQKADQTLESFGGVVASAENNLLNLEGLTKPLGERGPELADELISAVDVLGVALGDLQKFAAALNSSDGTISRLVNDPTLYEDITTVVGNVNVVLTRIDSMLKRIRPIIEDVRVFTYKIAVEPGRLVGGALNKGPGVK